MTTVSDFSEVLEIKIIGSIFELLLTSDIMTSVIHINYLTYASKAGAIITCILQR